MALTLSHPVALFIAQQIGIVIFVGFTPSTSLLRLSIGLSLVTALAYQITTSSVDRIFLTNIRNFLGLQSTTYILHYIDIALVGKWDFAAGGPTRVVWSTHAHPSVADKVSDPMLSKSNAKLSAKPDSIGDYDTQATCWARLSFGVRALVDNRGSNTGWESKGTPRFSSLDPEWVPSKGRFLLTGLLKVVALYLFIDVVTLTPSEQAAELNAPNRIDLFRRFHEVTLEELATRVVSSMVTWACIMALIEIVYSIMALLCVVFRLSKVEDWRPVFNSPLKAYTVRRFWR